MQILQILGDFKAEDTEVHKLLESCDSIRRQMLNSEMNFAKASYREWIFDFGKLNASQRAKVIN